MKLNLTVKTTDCAWKDHRRKKKKSTGSFSKGYNQEQIVEQINKIKTSKQADFTVNQPCSKSFYARYVIQQVDYMMCISHQPKEKKN